MNWNRIVVAAIAVLALVVAYDAVQRDDDSESRDPVGDYRIDLASSRDGSPLPASMLIEAFPGRRPTSLAVSKVAVDPHGTHEPSETSSKPQTGASGRPESVLPGPCVDQVRDVDGKEQNLVA